MSIRRTLNLLIIVAVMLISAPTHDLLCLPEVDEVVNGTADVTVDQNRMTISASNKAIINYTSFNIMQNESVIVTLPSYDSEILNRVINAEVSQLFGTLRCNGIFILTNESGIHVGPNAQIDVGGIILSTRDITNQNFLDNNYLFNRLSQDKLDLFLLNEGEITIQDGGFGVLIAGAIENKGKIIAKLGTIALASGDAVKLQLFGNSLISVAIEAPVAKTIKDYEGNSITDQIKNTGTLDAEGGTVILKAESINDIFTSAINLDGIVKGTRVEESEGIIRIVADGNVNIAGNIQATQINIGDVETIIPETVTIEETAYVVAEEVINIIADDYVNVESIMEAPEVNITSNGSIDTAPAAVIQATSLKLISNKFGAYTKALNLDAKNIYIERLNGDLNIMESSGIGTSILMRGPPDDWGAILYSKGSDLILNAQKVNFNGDSKIYLYGNITFYNFNCTTPWKEFYFEGGKTYTFKGNVNVAIPDEIHASVFFKSQEEGSPWYIHVDTDNYLFYKTAVQDSHNILTDDIYAHPSNNFGNNLGWNLNSNNFTPVTLNWDVGGPSGNWSVPGNWDTGIVPTSLDTVIFDSNSTATCIIDGIVTVATFRIDNDFGSTITQNYSLTVTGNFTMDSGAFEQNANFAVQGNYTQTGGTFTGSSNPSHSIDIDGAFEVNENTGTAAFTSTAGTMTVGGNVDITISDAIDLKTLTVSGDLAVTATGNITDSGTLDITGTTTLTAGANNNITLDDGSHSFNGSLTIISGNDVNIQGSGLIDFAASTISGNLTVGTGDNITDSGALSVTGTTTLTVESSASTILDHSGNNFVGAVSMTDGNNCTLVDANSIILGTMSLGGSLNVTASGTITDTGVITVPETTTLTAGAGNNITLDTTTNNFSGAVTIVSGNNVTLRDTNEIVLAALDIGGNLDVTAGTVTINGAIVTQGQVTIVATNSLTVDEDITSGDTTSITVASDGGTFTLTAGDTITSTSGSLTITADDIDIDGSIDAGGQPATLKSYTAGDAIDLGTDDNTASTLQLTDSDIDHISANEITIGAANAGAITISSDISSFDTARVYLVTNSTVTGTNGGIIFAGELSIDAGGAVTITDVSTDVDALAVSFSGTGNFSFTDADGLTIGIIGSITGIVMNNGSVTLSPGGQLDIDAAITAAGSGNGITVNNNNAIVISGVNLTTNGGTVELGTSAVTLDTNAVQISTGSGVGGNISLGGTVTGGSQSLTLQAGTGTVSLDTVTGVSTIAVTGSGDITLNDSITATSTITFHSGVELGDDLTLTATTITFNSTLDGCFILTISGTPVFNGAIGQTTALMGLVISDDQTITLDSDVSAVGNLNYDVPVLIAENIELTAGTVSFSSTVNSESGETNSLLITGNAEFSGVVGGVDMLSSLTVTGTTSIGANISTSGAQNYNDAVTLTDTANLTCSTVTFDSTVNGAYHLTVTGNGVFSGIVGGEISPTSLWVSDTTSIGANITTTDTQDYKGIVTLTDTTNLTGSTVTFDSTVNGTNALTVTGNAVFSGSVGETDVLSSLTVTGIASIGADITTSGAQNYNDALTILTDATISTGSDSSGNITLASTVNGQSSAQDLTLTAGTGTVIINGAVGGSNLINDLSINAATLTQNAAITTQGNLEITVTTALDLNTLTVAGALTAITSGAITDSGALSVTGVATFAAGSERSITLDTATNNFTGAVIVTSGADLTLVDANAVVLGAIGLLGTLNVTAAGAITQSGALSITGSATFTAGSTNNITLDNASNDFPASVFIISGKNVTLVARTAIDLATTTVSGTLDVTASGAITGSGIITVTGTTTLAAGADNNITLDSLANNFTGAVSISSGNNVTLIDGSAIDLGASTISGNLSVTASGAITDSGALSVTGTTTLTAGLSNNIILDTSTNDFTGAVKITSGNNVTLVDTNAIDLGASNISGVLDVTAAGAITDSGTLTVIGNTTLTAGSTNDITLDVITNDFTGSVSTSSCNNLKLSSSANLSLGTSTVSGTVDITAIGNIIINGDITSTLTQDYHSAVSIGDDVILQGSTISFSSTVNGEADESNSLTVTGNAVFDSTVGVSIGLSQLTVSGTSSISNDITTTGTQDYDDAVTLTGAATLGTTNSNITFGSTLNGNKLLYLNSGTGTITFTGAIGNSAALAGLTITDSGTVLFSDDITINGALEQTTGTTSTTFSDNTTIDINCAVTIGSSVLWKAGSSQWTVSGDWVNNGTFNAQTSTVEFDGTGTSTISGSNTFYNLTCETGGKTLQFEASSTQTITGALTLTGNSGDRIRLRSSSPGMYWYIDPQGTRSVSYVDVEDSYNSNSTSITATNSVKGGHTVNWSSDSSSTSDDSSTSSSTDSNIQTVTQRSTSTTTTTTSRTTTTTSSKTSSSSTSSSKTTSSTTSSHTGATSEETETGEGSEGPMEEDRETRESSQEEIEESGVADETEETEEASEEREGQAEESEPSEEEESTEPSEEETEESESAGEQESEEEAEEDFFVSEGDGETPRFRPGKYRTSVIVYEGTVMLNAETPLVAGQSIAIEGEVR